jgi:uncharacterized membrane protein
VFSFVTALLFPIYIPATGGYFSFSDIAVLFVSFAFGPITGLVAGGVGAGLADLSAGYAQFAPITLVAHGLEGLVAGLIAQRGRGVGWMLPAWIGGAVPMVLGYYLGETIVLQIASSQALIEAPFNFLQVIVGGIVGTALTLAVRRAYPQIDQLKQPRAWREMK